MSLPAITPELIEAMDNLADEVERVSKIRLLGAPSILFISESFVSSLRKIFECLEREGIRIVPITKTFPENVDKKDAVAIVTPDTEVPRGIYHWAVNNTEAANIVLSLFGTGIIQERAGIAFRTAGEGEAIPKEFHYDKVSILRGIRDAVLPASGNEAAEIYLQRQPETIDLDRESQDIIESALPAIKASCSANGAIAASAPPKSKNNPNYWFFWQRDAGQVAMGLLHLLKQAGDLKLKNEIQSCLKKFINFVSQLPHSDGIEFGDLGVSRFTMAGKPVKTYGNPQNDGPAITALAIMQILHNEPTKSLKTAKEYLDYLASPSGDGLTYDLWEISVGHFFYADNLVRKSLRKGKNLAKRFGDQKSEERYESQELKLIQRLKEYYDSEKGYITAGRNLAIPWMEVISKLDMAVVGSILTAYDVTDDFLNVDDPKVMKTMNKLEGEYVNKWAVNRIWKKTGYPGMGMGRFPEDTNDGFGITGGNPWVFTTLWAAQYYFRLSERYDFLRKKNFGDFARQPLLEKAEGYLKFVLSHLPEDALTEQIDGKTGVPRGAEKLAWAHAELCNTLILRNKAKSALA